MAYLTVEEISPTQGEPVWNDRAVSNKGCSGYASRSHHLKQFDTNKQAGQWARLHKQVRAAEEWLRQAEQAATPVPAEPPECAKQQPESAKKQAGESGERETALSLAEITPTGERQAQLRTIASDLLYRKGGLKVLRQARLPKWRGSFQWQIEAQIETLQAAYARVRAEAAKEGWWAAFAAGPSGVAHIYQ